MESCCKMSRRNTLTNSAACGSAISAVNGMSAPWKHNDSLVPHAPDSCSIHSSKDLDDSRPMLPTIVSSLHMFATHNISTRLMF